MAQYDLHLIQNVHGSGIEFSEKQVNLGKGGLLSANAANAPVVLPAGTNGHMIVYDDAEESGLKSQAVSGGHTQNTDTGTDNTIFELDNDGFKIELTAESASKFGVKVDGGATYADLEAKDATFAKVTVAAAPAAGSDLVNKTYADGLIAAADAMVYKGVIDASTNPNYPAADAGDTHKISVAGKIGGAAGPNVEIGDMIICTADATAAGDHATVGSSWTIIQVNIDGAVIGPASVTDGDLALFDGTSGNLIKAGTSAPGTMAYETATDYVAKALFDANTILSADTDNTPAALAVGEQTILGRKTGGNIAALTAAEAMNVLWQTAPATKISTGALGQIAKDDNYFYVCTATDVWKRGAIATNW